MNSSNLFDYTLFCITENNWINTTSSIPPTYCPVNPQHTIDQNSIVKVVNTRPSSTLDVSIKEETISTNGNYRFECLKCAVNSNDAQNVFNFSWPYPINCLSVKIPSGEVHRGDKINCYAIPQQSVIGQITSNISVGDNNISVSTSVINNIKIGYNICVNDGINNNYIGEISSINSSNSTVSLDCQSSNNYLCATPTSVNICFNRIKNLVFSEPMIYDIGGQLSKAAYVQSNADIKIIYNNNSLSNKTLCILIEYYY